MNLINLLIGLTVGLSLGLIINFLVRRRHDQNLLSEATKAAEQKKLDAESSAKLILDRAEKNREELIKTERQRQETELQRLRSNLEQDFALSRKNHDEQVQRTRSDLDRERIDMRESREQIRKDREKFEQLEDRLNRRGEQQDTRAVRLDEVEVKLTDRDEAVQIREAAITDLEQAIDSELQRISQLSKEQATETLLERLDLELEREKATRIRAALDNADSEANRKAYTIIAQAIQRSASEVSAAISVSVVPIPSDNMKGRIIGREGRNIRAFESLTGVDLIIDDTPEAVLLSSFNPIRREVAKLALSELLVDGRIHPARIEEVVHRSQQDMQNYIREKGEEAALEADVVGLKQGIIQLLGRMHFRTSYGQNMLKHSVQVAHLTGIIASHIDVDEAMARRSGLLHDIGKSIDREIEGTHTEIGANLGRRFGEPDEVIDAIHHHHDLDKADTLFPMIVNAADAISAARPGARRETLENYIKRLEGLESIAISFPGVEKSYAIQAGREIRIIVEPEKVDDSSAVLLARDIASRIEQDMEYPGQVQVTVVRESRAVEYAR
ncbi:MAG: ribonuclease Y [Trueperaceae bacterium]|jgi:ribonuclease Y|nr:ribonuclease Y [Trueperaceae bacterium]|tara:strand:- start:15993 stop:17663 length:1671 start_codon:yes stop_codon:yes gene_type:complete